MTTVADQGIPPQVWQVPDMKAAIAARNIGAVYRVLQRYGVSQRRIAALTQQSQSEISEIIAGRQVKSADVLARICDGLGIPRASLGVASDGAATASPPERKRCPRCAAQPGAEVLLVLTHAELELVHKILRVGLRSAARAHSVSLDTIAAWTGSATRVLRDAYRHTRSEFAAQLGVATRLVSRWEAGGDQLRPPTGSQGLLDAMLQFAPNDVRVRSLAALRPPRDESPPGDSAR